MTEKNRPDPETKDMSADSICVLRDDELEKVTGCDGPEALANIMKTRHDTAKNSINNVR